MLQDHSFSTNNHLAEKDEMVGVQKNIEVGDLLGKSLDCLSEKSIAFFNTPGQDSGFGNFCHELSW